MPQPNTLTFARLLDWVEGRLSDEEQQAIAEQLASAGAATHATLEWLRKFRAVSADIVLESPPPELRAQLAERFAAHTWRGPGLLQRLVATLTFDSSLQPALAGVRSAGVPPRQMIYATQIIDVALHIERRPFDQGFDINGQVFPKSTVAPSDFGAQLLHGSLEVAAAGVDDLGEFAFEALQPGRYDIALANDRYRVVLAQIELQR